MDKSGKKSAIEKEGMKEEEKRRLVSEEVRRKPRIKEGEEENDRINERETEGGNKKMKRKNDGRVGGKKE